MSVETLKAKFDEAPGVIKMGIALGGLVVGISVLSFGLRAAVAVVSNQPATGTPIVIETPEPESVTSTEAQPEQSERYQLWANVQASRISLLDGISEINRQMAQARAEKWRLLAQQKCNELGSSCPSPYSWLSEQLLANTQAIQAELLDGSVPTDLESVNRFRELLDRQEEIALAMSTDASTVAEFVTAGSLPQQLERFYGSTQAFEAQRQAEAMEAYSNE